MAMDCSAYCDEQIRWGKSRTSHRPVSAEKGESGGLYTCFVCHGELSFVNKYKRTVCGRKQNVRSFFRHTTGEGKKGAAGCFHPETYQHRAAKSAIASVGEKWKFYYHCLKCRSKEYVTVTSGEISGNIFKEELPWKKKLLDVGVTCNADLVGAVEIHYSHESTKEKIDLFNIENIGWVEVMATKVLAAYDDNTYEVEISKCHHSHCESCKNEIVKQKIYEMEAKIFRSLQVDEKEAFDKISKEAGDDFKINGQKYIHEKLKKQLIDEDAEIGCFFARQAFELCKQIKPRNRHSTLADDVSHNLSCLTHSMMQDMMTVCAQIGVTRQDFIDHFHEVTDPDATILATGKHSGRTLEAIAEEEFSYVVWLAGHQRLGTKYIRHTKNKCFPQNVIDEAQELIKGFCYNCGDQMPSEADSWMKMCSDCWREYR